jgi:cation diffusion facilitator CzcD-associated flavoprotein CzcO
MTEGERGRPDLIIVGAGPAGIAAAAMRQICQDHRICALRPGS